MRRRLRLVLAGVLAALPLATFAQAPAPASVTITPYGFVLMNAFWNTGPFSSKEAANLALTDGTGGAFGIAARSSRFGFRASFPQEGWTGAKLTANIEMDFRGGYVPTTASITCVAPTPPATAPTCTLGGLVQPSTSWYNALPRIRHATATATWGTSFGDVYVMAGQQFTLAAPLGPTTIAWTGTTMFGAAGNAWSRTPQIRLGFAGNSDPIGFDLALSVGSPRDNVTPVDFGAGNKSRMPDLEGRLAAFYKMGGKKMAEVGLSGHVNTRRYVNPTNDVTASLFALDAKVSLPYVTVLGEAWTAKGVQDFYDMAGTGTPVNTTTNNSAVAEQGFWVQAVASPVPYFDVYLAFALDKPDEADMRGLGTAASQVVTRNQQLAGGVIVNASKAWKLSLEVVQTKTRRAAFSVTPAVGSEVDAVQVALASKLDF